MSISKEIIEHIANLANFYLGDLEKEKLAHDMGNILSFVEKLNELDTSNIEPSSHAIPIKNVFREDIVKNSYPQEVMLKNAPLSENGCYKVPKIVE